MSAMRTRAMAAIAGVLALAVLTLWLLRAGPLPPERAATAPPSPPISLELPAPAPASLQAPGDTAPPWNAPSRTGTVPSAISDPAASPRPAVDRNAALAEIQRQLVELSASGQAADVQKIDRLLGEVERVQGSSTIGGVKIDVLRHNLAIAQKMQALAKDIEEASSRGAQADPKQLQAQMARIVELQAQMRTDVVAAPAAVPASAGR